MTTRRFVLLHKSGVAPDADFGVIERTPGVRIIDRTQARALLVEASDTAIAQLRGSLTGWILEEETMHPHPKKL